MLYVYFGLEDWVKVYKPEIPLKHQKQRFPQQLSWKVVGFAILTAAAVSGCMTTSRGVNQTVEINSYPYEARVYIDGELAGTTPLSAVLRSKSTYEVKFEKAGYKPFVEYIGPSLDLKHDPILKIGPLEEAGFYNRLGPSPLEVELEHVLVPDIAGPDILRELLVKTEQIDRLLSDGKIGSEEHRYIGQQILDFYKDESARRGAPLLSMAPVPAQPTAVQELPPPAFPANPTTPMTVPGELGSLDNLDLDSINDLELPSPGTPTTVPAATSTGIPDLSGLDNLSLPNSGNLNVPALEPVAAPPPPLAPPPTSVEPTPLPNPIPNAPTPPTTPETPANPTPTPPAAPSTPAPFDPLNFGT